MKDLASLRKVAGVTMAGALLAIGSIIPASAAPSPHTDPSATEQALEGRADAESTGEVAPGITQEDGEPEEPAETLAPEEKVAQSAEPATGDSVKESAVGLELSEGAVVEDSAVSQFSTSLGCEPAKIFAVTNLGNVFSVNETGEVASQVFDGWSKLYSAWKPISSDREKALPWGVNGLALAADGTMYAYARGFVERTDLKTDYNLRIRMLVKRPGDDWAWLDSRSSTSSSQTTYAVAYSSAWNSANPWAYPVTGAIDPKTGNYVWGEISNAGEFIVREIDLTTQQGYVSGKVSVGLTGTAQAPVNGDIAYDHSGNLYIVAQSGNAMTITTVKASDIAANRVLKNDYSYRPKVATPGTTVQVAYSSGVNGIAVGADGGLYVSTAGQIVPVNPLTGEMGAQVAGNQYDPASNPISDLSSCATNSPTTLTLQKDLQDGGKSSDEFNLSVSYGGSEISSTTAKTRAQGTTVLEETTGPTWVQTGAEVTLSETGANLANYTSELRCAVDGEDAVSVTAGARGATGTIIIPAEAAGKNVTCTFTNVALPSPGAFSCEAGTVYWLTPGGKISDSKTVPNTAPPTVGWNVPSADSANALGIGKNGNTAYALQRYAGYSHILGYSNVGGTETWNMLVKNIQDATAQTNVARDPAIPSAAVWNRREAPGAGIAGAVDPATGKYFFGGYQRDIYRVGSSNEWWQQHTFVYRTYDPETGTVSGLLTIPVGSIKFDLSAANTQPAANGDIAFDDSGNLYLAVGSRLPQGNGSPQGVNEANVYSVAKENIGASSTFASHLFKLQGDLPFTGTTGLEDVVGNLNGIAFGRVNGQPAGAYGLVINTINQEWLYTPSSDGTWVQAQNKAILSPNPKNIWYGDAASCYSPPSLTLQKDFKGRVAQTDQVELLVDTVEGGSATGAVAHATTSGTTNGIQAQIAGPALTAVGRQYVISEKQAGEPLSDLSKYDRSYQCTDSNGNVFAEGLMGEVDTNGVSSATLKAIDSNDALTCTITNAPKPKLTLKKTVNNPVSKDGTPLGSGYASEGDWTLKATNTSGGTVEISGVTGSDAVSGAVLSAGSYTLDEQYTKTPDISDSYELTDLTCVTSKNVKVAGVSVDSRSLPLASGDDVACTFTNTPKTGTVVWEKVDDSEPANPLNNSGWTITGPEGAGSEELEVADCVADDLDGCSNSVDKDHRAGYFKVTGLVWGDYELEETKAPAGYVLDGEAHSFSISGAALDHKFKDPFVNEQYDGPTLPLTGGMSAASFAFLGLGLFGVAFLGGLVLRKKGAGVQS